MAEPIRSPSASSPARPWTELEFHGLANIFPLLEEGSPTFETLVEDIRMNGQQEPIVLYEEKILEGRNRYRACKRIGKEPKTKPYTGSDPIGFVLSANLHRRHLNESQRAMVGANLAKLGVGTNQHTKGQGPSIEGAAAILNVGHASIERARKVLNSGDASLVDAVKKGTISVSAAAACVDQPQKKQQPVSKKPKSTPLDRFENAWGKLEMPQQLAFVETKYRELAKLMKEVDRTKAAA